MTLIVWLDWKEEELTSLVDRLGKTSAASGMEISVEKTKLMTNNTNGINIDIRINGEILDEVDSFKYLDAVVTDQGSKPWSTVQNCTDKSSTSETEDHLEQ